METLDEFNSKFRKQVIEALNRVNLRERKEKLDAFEATYWDKLDDMVRRNIEETK
jgi:hypothetical protein